MEEKFAAGQGIYAGFAVAPFFPINCLGVKASTISGVPTSAVAA
jgi:hypothetical protein